MPKQNLVMVLNDGETYTGLENCKIIALDEELFNEHDVSDDADKVVIDTYFSETGETEHGKIVAEFGFDRIVVGEPVGAQIQFQLKDR